jgi:hypothetical protein
MFSALGIALLIAAGSADGEEFLPVSADSLPAYHGILFSSRADTLFNCLRNGESGLPFAVKEEKDTAAENRTDWDAFHRGGTPITGFTFQRKSGRYLYFLATLEDGSGMDYYEPFCFESGLIGKAYVVQSADLPVERPPPKPAKAKPERDDTAFQLFFSGGLLAILALLYFLSS